jgi:hypothetical protein
MLLRETTAVYSENHKKHACLNTLFAQNVEFLKFQQMYGFTIITIDGFHKKHKNSIMTINSGHETSANDCTYTDIKINGIHQNNLQVVRIWGTIM